MPTTSHRGRLCHSEREGCKKGEDVRNEGCRLTVARDYLAARRFRVTWVATTVRAKHRRPASKLVPPHDELLHVRRLVGLAFALATTKNNHVSR